MKIIIETPVGKVFNIIIEEDKDYINTAIYEDIHNISVNRLLEREYDAIKKIKKIVEANSGRILFTQYVSFNLEEEAIETKVKLDIEKLKSRQKNTIHKSDKGIKDIFYSAIYNAYV